MMQNPLWKNKLGDTYDLVETRLEQMKDPQVTFDPFTGPMRDRNGKLFLKDGERMNYFDILTSA